jgi:hypothetical protein
VFALDAGDDSNSNSNSKTTATATGGGGGGGPVAHLRRLFALMQAGARRFADPSAFASSLALETGTQVRSIHWSPYDRVGVVNANP